MAPGSSLEGVGGLSIRVDVRMKMVGTTGFEPATSCSQSRRATRLRHVPTRGDILAQSL